MSNPTPSGTPSLLTEENMRSVMEALGQITPLLSRLVAQGEQTSPILPVRFFQAPVETPEEPVDSTIRPLSPDLISHTCPPKYRPPHVQPYDGVRDPEDHLNTFRFAMEFVDAPAGIECRTLAATLHGAARRWHLNLPPGCITSLADFGRRLSL